MNWRTFLVGSVATLTTAVSLWAQPITLRDKIPYMPAEVKKQVVRLYSSDPIERNRGCEGLAAMKEKAKPAIPFLVEILADNAPVMRHTRVGDSIVVSSATPGSQAATAIAQMGNAGFEALTEQIKANKNEEARRNVARALGGVSDRRAVDVLIEALKDKSKWVRYDAAWSLGQLKDGRSLEPLRIAFRDPDRDVRSNAADALSRLGTKGVAALLTEIKNEDPNVRELAAGALGSSGDAQALLPLLSALKDQSGSVRHSAAYGLRNFNDRRSLHALVEALKDGDTFVRQVASQSLQEMTGQDFGQDAERWLDWINKKQGKPTKQ